LGAIELAEGLTASVITDATDSLSNQIALWPDQAHPTHLFVCMEHYFSGNNPNQISVQRITMNGTSGERVDTIVKGLSACDPIRRTGWGTLLLGEEAEDGGL
jgi:hypothetical protein